MQKAHKAVRTREVLRFMQQRIVPSMEIHANSRLNLARNNRCTNVRSMLKRSRGCGEFKNVNTEFVQKVHKAVRTREVLRFMQRRIVQSMEIHANSRLNLARNNRCTNVRSMLKRSRGCGEFKNVNTEFVQKAHKPVRTRKVLRFMQRHIVQSMEIHANSRIKP